MWSNHPELSPVASSPFITVVRGGSVQSNSLQTALDASITVVRGSSVSSNCPELTQTCPVGLLPPS